MRDGNDQLIDAVDRLTMLGREFLNSALIKDCAKGVANWGFKHTLLIEELPDGATKFTVYHRIINISRPLVVTRAKIIPARWEVELDGSYEWRCHRRLWIQADTLKAYYASPDARVYIRSWQPLIMFTQR